MGFKSKEWVVMERRGYRDGLGFERVGDVAVRWTCGAGAMSRVLRWES